MRLQRRSAFLILLWSLAAAPSFAAPEAEVFARLPTFTDLAISPGGRYLAARVNIDNQFAIQVFDLSGARLSRVYGVAENDELAVDWFRWVAEERLLLSVGFSGVRGSRREVQTEERRLMSLNTQTKELIPLFRSHRSEVPIQIQDRIVSFLPNDPEHVLVQYSSEDASRPNVYRVNVSERGGHKLVQKGRFGVRYWTADADGDIRIGSGLIDDDSKRFLIMWLKDEKKWLNFSHRVLDESREFSPRGFAAEPNKIYVTSNHEGDPAGLYLFDIVADEFSDLIFRHPSVDIRTVNIDDKTGELMSVSFIEDEVEIERFATLPIHDAVDGLRKQFPEQDLRISTISDDGRHAVLLSKSATDAGRYLLYDSIANGVKALPSQYPGLDGVELGQTFVAEYAARDELVIPAFVSLPPGLNSLAEAQQLPFVIYPHGGPSARDFLRFSFRVQFLLSRGYGVLQMNFRGSEGYGQEFSDAGRREWGQAMQDDISDGVEWLVASGVADPDRLAIMGGSYGGYAALMGVVKTPDLYQCGISFAGVSDLPELLRTQERFIGGSYATRHIGDLWKDRKMLAENSPARRADAVTVPVLLMHGDADTVVNIDQSERMEKALRKAGKQVEFFTFENGDHYLSLYENRLQYLQHVERFLGSCLN